MRSFPPRAAHMPGSERMVETTCGLQARRMRSARWTPWRFWFCRTVRCGVRGESSSVQVWAEEGRVTQAMKRVGIRGGRLSQGLLEVRMPRIMALPRVPSEDS